jgi:argininosuccinate lyase
MNHVRLFLMNMFMSPFSHAGNAFGLDRHELAKSLGFSSPTTNSLDTVCDRDHVAELIFWASMTMTHLSQV